MDYSEIVNLTNTPLKFIDVKGNFLTIPSSGDVRIDMQRFTINKNGYYEQSEIKVNNTRMMLCKGMPPKKKGTIYIVSTLVYQFLHNERDDIYIIDEPQKEKGAVMYAKSITRPVYLGLVNIMKEISELTTELANCKKTMSEVELEPSIAISTDERMDEILFQIKSITDKYIVSL